MRTHKKPKILIIGAGIAGLAACNFLSKHGFDVTILEARERIGGRVFTDFSLGIPFDLGASWIHGTEGNPLVELAKLCHARYVFTDFDRGLFFDRHHQVIPMAELNLFHKQFEDILELTREFTRAAPQDMSLLTALTQVINLNQYSSTWQDLWNRCLKELSLYMGADLAKLSARKWDEEEIIPGGNHLMLDGYMPIAHELAKQCSIQFNHIVKKIISHNDYIEVVTQREKFQCDKVIITVPFSILKNNLIQFEPALPDIKLKALEHLHMGLLNKVALKFSHAFWPTDYASIAFSSKSTISITDFVNFFFAFQQPILVGFSAGTPALAIEKLSDSEIVELVMQNLRDNFGNKIPQPEKYIITRWAQDPFAQGSYSYISVGGSGEAYTALAEPIDNRLFFAGEATHKQFPATVHGALLSGLREAKRFL